MYRFRHKQLPILLLFLFHISRLQSHYPAVTPKCLISTGVIWSIGVKCLIRTGNMVISSCHSKTTNGLKNAPEAISEGLKFKNFPGRHASTHLYFCQFVVLWAILFPPALQLWQSAILLIHYTRNWMLHHGVNLSSPPSIVAIAAYNE